MPSNKARLNAANLYIILDAEVLPHQQLLDILPLLVKSGVDIVQLRDKKGKARDLVAFSKQALKITNKKTLFIVNDRVDVALAVKADGIHVGQDDLSLADTKALITKKMLVGVSCQEIAHARRAMHGGADYIGFGSIFKTKTKPERNPMPLNHLQNVHKQIKIPIFAIGGINKTNVKSLLNVGVKRVAICREVLLNKNPRQVIKELNGVLSAGVIQW